MADTQYLEELIKKSGKKKGYLAQQIGCTAQYFTMKCRNEAPFKTTDVEILCKELDIPKKDIYKVFFA